MYMEDLLYFYLKFREVEPGIAKDSMEILYWIELIRISNWLEIIISIYLVIYLNIPILAY